MSTRRSTTETAEQKLSRLQEESDRAQQKAAEMAQAVADAKEESEAEAKRVAEEKQAQEEKRVQDAKKKEDTKKRSEAKKKAKKKTSDDDYEEGGPSKSVRGAADGDQVAVKPKRNSVRTPPMIEDEEGSISDRIVESGGWPSCLACVKARVGCKWKLDVVNPRLHGIPNKAKNCEECIRKQIACQFIWDSDSNKRIAEDALEQGASKRIQLDCPVELINCLASIGTNLGALVKYAVAQSVAAREEHVATAAMFDTLQTSLEDIHGKLNDM